MRTLKNSLCVITLIVFAVNIAGCRTTARQHPDFFKRIERIKTAAIMPARTGIVYIEPEKQNILLTEKAAEVGKMANLILAEHLKENGFEIVNCNIDEIRKNDSLMSLQMIEVKQRCIEAIEQMYDDGHEIPVKEAADCTIDLGPGIKILADLCGADALVFVHIEGYERRSNYILDFLRTREIKLFGTISHQRVNAVIVDASIGQVLWAGYASTSDSRFSEKSFCANFRRMFEHYPVELEQ